MGTLYIQPTFMSHPHTSVLDQLHVIHTDTCIIYTEPGYPHYLFPIHFLRMCHSHMASVHTLLNLCAGIIHTQHVSLMYLFLFLPHTGSLGDPGQPKVSKWVWRGGGQRCRAWTPIAEEKRWPLASRLVARKL